MLHPIITIYTDGSCHTQQLVGAWAAIIFIGAKKFVLSGTEENTTHNRMELTAIIEALKFTEQLLYVWLKSANPVEPNKLETYTGSPAAENLPEPKFTDPNEKPQPSP